ncbi:MAG: hypothetical protein ACRYGL_20315 [Janthinobacterium lividum]
MHFTSAPCFSSAVLHFPLPGPGFSIALRHSSVCILSRSFAPAHADAPPHRAALLHFIPRIRGVSVCGRKMLHDVSYLSRPTSAVSRGRRLRGIVMPLASTLRSVSDSVLDWVVDSRRGISINTPSPPISRFQAKPDGDNAEVRRDIGRLDAQKHQDNIMNDTIRSYRGFDIYPLIYSHVPRRPDGSRSHSTGFDASVKICKRDSQDVQTGSKVFRVIAAAPFPDAGDARRASTLFAEQLIDGKIAGQSVSGL